MAGGLGTAGFRNTLAGQARCSFRSTTGCKSITPKALAKSCKSRHSCSKVLGQAKVPLAGGLALGRLAGGGGTS